MRLFAHRALVHAARLHYAQPHRGYHNAGHLDELIVLARLRGLGCFGESELNQINGLGRKVFTT
ncbi:hypothetical protein BH10PSE6_BH10PSE6_21030 [soil metagenome]